MDDYTLLSLREQRVEQLETVLRNLVNKLELLIPYIDGVFVMEALHGRPYKGPNLAEELRAAKKLLGM